jgi:hypothetical protein
MKIKTIVGVSVLLASCAAMAGDSPFETGKTYTVVGIFGGGPVEIKDVKGKWILVNANGIPFLCESFKNNECWINTDQITAASTAK